jgi:hypothetical protein
MRKWYRDDGPTAKKADRLLKDLYEAFGWKTRVLTPLIGSYAYAMLKREDGRLSKGWVYEPGCFYEKNEAALATPSQRDDPMGHPVRKMASLAGRPVPTS